MTKLGPILAVPLLAIAIAGCETGTSSTRPIEAQIELTPEEIARLEIEFERTAVEPPARSIAKLRERLEGKTWRHIRACDGGEFYHDIAPTGVSGSSNDQRNAMALIWRDGAAKALKYGDFDRAVDHISRASATVPTGWNFDKSGMEFARSIYLSMVGATNSARFAYQSGIRHWSRGLQVNSGHYKKAARTRVAPFRRIARAFMLQNDGNHDRAELLLRSLAGYYLHEGMPTKLRSYFHIMALVNMGRLDEAEVIARQHARSNPREIDAMWSYDALAYVFQRQGRHRDAEWVARIAYDFFAERCAPLHYFVVARAYLRLARSLTALGRWAEALALFEAIDAARDRDASGVTEQILLGNPDWGVALLAAGRTQEAIVKLQDARDVIATLEGNGSLSLLEVDALLALGGLEGAAGTAAAQLAFTDALDRYVIGLTRAQTEGADLAARERRTDFLVTRYLAYVADHGSAETQRDALTYAQLGQGGKVQAALAASAVRTNIDDPRLRRLVRKQQDAANRARELARLILARSTARDDIGDSEEVPLAALIAERKTLDQASRQLLAEIETQYPEFSALLANRPATPSEAASVLHAGEALVFIRTTPQNTYIWAIDHTGRSSFSAAPLDAGTVRDLVDAVRASVDPSGIQFIADIPYFEFESAAALYDALIRPLEATLQDARSLVFVADGALRQLPPSLLVAKAPAGALTEADDADLRFSRYRQVGWLADRWAVSMVPTLNALTLLRKGTAVAAERALIAFGDPYFSVAQAQSAQTAVDETAGRRGGDFAVRNLPATRNFDSALLERLPRLPDTRAELQAIAEALDADPVRDVILGERASELAVRNAVLDRYRNIAFATHGLTANDLDGLYEPALALSSPKVTGEAGDGLLTMSEILNLRMNADWVILSACNTAAADGEGAEAVAGLGRAFFYAGARALLVSNWPVHSQATTALTTAAFREISTTGASRAEAMRRARVGLIQEGVAKNSAGKTLFSYAHPLFWAPFVVVGDGGLSTTSGQTPA